MTNSQSEQHWQSVYTAKGEHDVSWFEESPELSLDLISTFGREGPARIIDVGGGASRLVDRLLAEGRFDVTVLDLSAQALAIAAGRLGENRDKVRWIAADITTWRPDGRYDIWHDRAAFHFLTTPEQQRAYRANLLQVLETGGIVIIATFAPDGPEKCSGLPVARHDGASIAAVLGNDFELIETRPYLHRTPWGAAQAFQFSILRRRN